MPMVQEIDYGTPAVTAPKRRSRSTIDGHEVTVPEGTSDHACVDGGRHQGAEAVRHRHAEQLRQLPACAWWRSKVAPARRPPAPPRSRRE